VIAEPNGFLIVGSTAASIIPAAAVAAVVAAVVSLTTFLLDGRRSRLDRQRQLFAEAFEAVALYNEYPFIVRRRGPDAPDSERVRISGDLSALQARLASLCARLKVEAPKVGAKYEVLVATTRRVAGEMIREAWNEVPVTADSEIHSPGLDFSEIEAAEEPFLDGARRHLMLLRWPGRK
jgi:hypothetical protein